MLATAAVWLCAACAGPTINVTEVFNYSQCKNLSPGLSRLDFRGLADIRGTRMLEEHGAGQLEPGASSNEQELVEDVLLAVFNGQQPTPGYGFKLQQAKAEDNEIRLHYLWLRPSADAVLAQVMTSPCSVVRLHGAQDGLVVSAWLDGQELGRLTLD